MFVDEIKKAVLYGETMGLARINFICLAWVSTSRAVGACAS
jgi:hypothetical protein